MVRPMLPPTRASVGPAMNQRARSSGSTRYCQTLSTGASSKRSKRSMAGVAWSVWRVSVMGVLLAGFAGCAHTRGDVVLQCALQRVEAGGPEPLPLAQPVAGVLQPFRPDPAQVLSPDLVAFGQSGLRQHGDLLGGARDAHPVPRGQVADGFLAQHQVGQHPATGRVGQGGKGAVEVLFNHEVEYCVAPCGLSTVRLNVGGRMLLRASGPRRTTGPASPAGRSQCSGRVTAR